jgi:hypothetical protein
LGGQHCKKVKHLYYQEELSDEIVKTLQKRLVICKQGNAIGK